MYFIIVNIFWVVFLLVILAEWLYRAYELYSLWVEGEETRTYSISYDFIINGNYGQGAFEYAFASVLRVALGFLGAPLLALVWPLTLLIVAFIAFAKHDKATRKLKKEYKGLL